MTIMRVYAHYHHDKGSNIEYRWRTLLQLGKSWEVCGTVIMKNPGSSHPITWDDGKPIPISDVDIQRNLDQFEKSNSLDSKEWFEFSVDSTMRHVGHLIEAYLEYNKQIKEGIIQIINLFNVIDQSLEGAIEKYDPLKINTIEEDIKSIKQYSKLPIYIGWGDLWRNKLFYNNARRLFDAVKAEMPYIDPIDIENNYFYHPQYLLGVGKNRSQCLNHYISFIRNRRTYKNEYEKIFAIKAKINKNGTNQWIEPEGMLVYEYYCKSNEKGYIKENGTVSIGIFYKSNQCCFSVMTKGNHPEDLLKNVQDTCDEFKIFKMYSKDCFKADVGTDDGKIVEFFNVLLAKIKDYRETDFPK